MSLTVDRPSGCICTVFSDTGGFRIADLCCPVHGVGGSDPGDGYWDREGDDGPVGAVRFTAEAAQFIASASERLIKVATLWDQKPSAPPSEPVIKAFAHHGVHYDPGTPSWYCEGAGIRLSVIMCGGAAHLAMTSARPKGTGNSA